MKRFILFAGALLTGCSNAAHTYDGATPTTPTPPIPPMPTTYTISGTVTATNGGQALSGIAVDLGGSSATTDGAGRYSLTLALSLASPVKFQVSGAGLLTHTGLLHGGSSRTVDLDAIRLDGTFDPAFYRQFVYNALDTPLYAIARWTQAPKIYIQTIDDAGHSVEPRTLNATVNAFISTIGALTGGRFGFDAIEQGTGSKIGEAGWTTVRWLTAQPLDRCGQAIVGREGTIDFFYKIPRCACEGVSQTGLAIVRHELGHALGYWHTDSPSDLMFHTGPPCDRPPSARERYHAAIMYSRMVGNTDPDNDPTDSTYAKPLSVALP